MDEVIVDYENPSKAAVWQWAMDSWIKSRPYASVAEIIKLTDECADAYAERFCQKIDAPYMAEIIPFEKI